MRKLHHFAPIVFGFLVSLNSACAADPIPTAINQLGLDLLRAQTSAASEKPANILLSPYSIQTALAMAYIGAAGKTHDEMRRALHLPADNEVVADGFAALAQQLDEVQKTSRRRCAELARREETVTPIELHTANRLFAQSGFEFRPAYLDTLRDTFRAALAPVDFKRDFATVHETINAWVAHQTHDRIKDIVSPGVIDENTRAVIVNAIYLKAPWASAFDEHATKPGHFWPSPRSRIDVPTMFQRASFGYDARSDYTVITLPYDGGDLQLVILLPEKRDALHALEKSITAEALASCAELPRREIDLHLPRFKIDPPGLSLGEQLRRRGMTTAFDEPKRSANFSGIAPPSPDGYLKLSDVFHRTWLSLDENGTEAAAASAATVELAPFGTYRPPPIPIIRVDHPFLFAIQHVPSRTCLFIGHVVNPP